MSYDLGSKSCHISTTRKFFSQFYSSFRFPATSVHLKYVNRLSLSFFLDIVHQKWEFYDFQLLGFGSLGSLFKASKWENEKDNFGSKHIICYISPMQCVRATQVEKMFLKGFLEVIYDCQDRSHSNKTHQTTFSSTPFILTPWLFVLFSSPF